MKYKVGKKSKKIAKRTSLFFAVVILVGSLYLLLLTQSPKLALGTKAYAEQTKLNDVVKTNRVNIPKIGVNVEFFEGNQSVLERGAWHRLPERGNPEIGGNFILSAHRFNLGLTPQGTKQRSPFYKLDKLTFGDSIEVTFNQKKYLYRVSKVYDVGRSDIEIEAPSVEPKLTLYSCSLKGEEDGRVVVEALPN